MSSKWLVFIVSWKISTMRFLLLLSFLLLGALCPSGDAAMHGYIEDIDVTSQIGPINSISEEPQTDKEKEVSKNIKYFLNDHTDDVKATVFPTFIKEFPLITLQTLNNSTLKMTKIIVKGASEYVFEDIDVYSNSKVLHFKVNVPNLQVTYDIQGDIKDNKGRTFSGGVSLQLSNYSASGKLKLKLERLLCASHAYYQVEGILVYNHVDQAEYTLQFDTDLNPLASVRDELFQKLYDTVLQNRFDHLNHVLNLVPSDVVDAYVNSFHNKPVPVLNTCSTI